MSHNLPASIVDCSIQSASARSGPKDWTVMVYLEGDNNLSENMAYSLESLGRLAGSLSEAENSRINILASFNGSSLTAPPMYLDYSDCEMGEPVRQAAPRQRSTSSPGDDLLDFIGWCTTAENGRGRKARNYALILSGHSLGFHGNTLLRQESTGQYLTLTGLRAILEKANELYLTEAGGQIAILGFDSCVMSMVEVGYEFKDVARILIASEGSLPNSGWGYASMLSSFVSSLVNEAGPTPSDGEPHEEIRDAARSFVSSFTEFYRDISIGGGSIDISAWDLTRVDPLVSAVNQLGARLNSALLSETNPSFRELKRVLLQGHYDSQTYMADQCVDIRDLCERLIDECAHLTGLRDAEVFEGISCDCADAIAAVDACVLKCGFSGDAYQFSNGISIFFPWSHVAFALTDAQYRALRFVHASGHEDSGSLAGPGFGWYSFLLNYVGKVTVRRARAAAKVRYSPMTDCDSIYATQPSGVAGDSSPFTRDAVPFTKDAVPFTKDAVPFTKDAVPFTKDAVPFTRDAVPFTKGFGENGNYLSRFRSFKNFELGWDISGFADDRPDAR